MTFRVILTWKYLRMFEAYYLTNKIRGKKDLGYKAQQIQIQLRKK